ncbi:MAG: GTPase Obg [Anaerolineales bacterium]|nr:GTPase Obg [Anaerolineales bacterium]
MFTDQVEIHVRSGKGGDGMVHFHREKFIPRGGPDGGDGGKGGDVVFEVRHTLNTLSAFRQNQKFRAEDGIKGGPSQMSGRAGKDLVIHVPPGTVIFDITDNSGGDSPLFEGTENSGGETPSSGGGTPPLLGDLTQSGQRLVVCKGGRGGRGNQHFATSRNQAPRTAEKGAPHEERRLRLELKLIADIGLIGVPNAGKSTLLSVLTNAKPKIAAYPFTTLEPNLGVAEIDVNASVVLADIPGLIEGASHGAGLGHDFLRHVQRTRVLIHLLDGLSEDPVADYSQINSELSLFDPNLGQKPQIVALNKIDQPDVQEKLAEIQKQFKKRKVELMTISALARTNTRDLLIKAYQKLQDAPAPESFDAPLPVYKPKEDPRAFEVKREGAHEWRVIGVSIERAAKMTYWEHDGSLRRFQKIMETLGIEKSLREAGIEEGDTVAIGDFELEWQD